MKFSVFVGFLGIWYVLPVFWYYLVYSPMLGITKVLKLACLGHFLCFPITDRFATVFLRCSTEFWLFWPVSGDFAILPFSLFLVAYSVQHRAFILPIFTKF